jgi:hypothetical protein
MAVDEVEEPSPLKSCMLSYTLWVESHPVPSSGLPLALMNWLCDTLQNEVLEAGLAKFIKTLSMAMPPLGREKFVQNRLTLLERIAHEVEQPPFPGT